MGNMPMDRAGHPLPPSEAQLLSGMSDANILGHLAATDSLEVALSDTAILHSKSDTVLKYARSMRAMHLASLNAVKVIAKETGLGLTTMTGELRRTHMFATPDSVTNASDLTIDRHYVLGQIELHQHMIGELELLQTVAKNPRVRDHIAAEIPNERQNLAKARALAHVLGYEVKRGKA
jgi:predicted outer membrane protein